MSVDVVIFVCHVCEIDGSFSFGAVQKQRLDLVATMMSFVSLVGPARGIDQVRSIDTMDASSMMAGLGAAGGPPPAAVGPSDDGSMQDLSSKIDKSACYARNEAPGFGMSNLFIGDSRLGCKSDADEQLIIHIAFQEFVKVKTIKFVAFNEGSDPECNPSTVKVYVNRENLGFEDIDDVDPTQVFDLTAEELRESSEPIPTKFVKFQRVKSLTIFVEDNNGGEVSALGMLRLMGRPVATTNMSEFKKNPNEM